MNIPFINYILLTGVLLCSFSCIKEGDDKDNPHLEKEIETGDAVPAFIIYENENKTGKTFNSKDFEGKVSLLVFFHSECGDCQRELPKINRIWESLHDYPDFQVVTIARKQTRSETDMYWKEQGFTMPKYVDPEREVYNLFANQTVPRIYLINTKSIVTWMAIEELTIGEGELIELIRKTE